MVIADTWPELSDVSWGHYFVQTGLLEALRAAGLLKTTLLSKCKDPLTALDNADAVVVPGTAAFFNRRVVDEDKSGLDSNTALALNKLKALRKQGKVHEARLGKTCLGDRLCVTHESDQGNAGKILRLVQNLRDIPPREFAKLCGGGFGHIPPR